MSAEIRHRVTLTLILFLSFIAFASYHPGTGSTAWLQWVTLIIMLAFAHVFDKAFTNSSMFVFDPDADNWRRKTEAIAHSSERLQPQRSSCDCVPPLYLSSPCRNPARSATPEQIRQWVEEGDLHSLVKANPSVEDVQELLENYPDKVNEEGNSHRWLPLHTAAFYNASVGVINLLLEKNKSAAETKTAAGYVPLEIALSNECGTDIVKALLLAYPDGAKENGMIDRHSEQLPLHIALEKKYGVDVVQTLLDAHPDAVKVKDYDGDVPLHFAMKGKCGVDVVEALIDAYPEGANAKNKKGRLPLHVAVEKGCELDVVQKLLSEYPEGAKEVLPIFTVLKKSPSLNNCEFDLVKALLDACPEGAKEKDWGGRLPLHNVVRDGYGLNVVEALLDAHPEGAKERDKTGKLPLHFAMMDGCGPDVVKLLLNAYPDGVKEKNEERSLPLHLLLIHYDFDKMKVLIDKYPDGAKEVDKWGNLPLHFVMEKWRNVDILEYWPVVDVIKMLVKAYPVGASKTMCNGILPFVYALETNYPADILFALLEADMPVRLDDGLPKRHNGTWNHCVSLDDDRAVDLVIRILSPDKGGYWKHIHALANARDADGRIAVDMAKSKSREIIHKYLLFCKRFEIQVGPLEHLSLTSVLMRAQDLHPQNDYSAIFKKADKDSNGNLDRIELEDLASSLGLDPELFLQNLAESEGAHHISEEDFIAICKRQLGDGPREVVIKFMQSKDHWERECNARKGLNSKYVVLALTNVPSDEEFAEAVQGRTGGLDIIKEKFLEEIEIGEHAIVMHAADRNLQQIFYQERPEIGAVREILRQVFEAVKHLHETKLMHGDLKMLNIVRMRVDSRLRLIDFDASAKIMQPGEEGESFAGAKFSSAILPPEMIAKIKQEEVEGFNAYWGAENDEGLKDKVAPKAHMQQGVEVGQYVVKSFRTEGGKPIDEELLPYDLVEASENIDAWSLGVLAFSLLTGEPLIPCTRDDDCLSGAAMHLLYTWGEQPKILLDRLKKIPNKAARHLVYQLLDREPSERPSIADLLENHAFFHPLDSDLISFMNEKFDKVNGNLERQAKQIEMIRENILVVKELSFESKIELLFTREALMKGIFEADEVDIPTTFILLQHKLAEIVKLKEGDSQNRIIEYVQKMVKMMKEGVQEQLVEETMYLYLVDDLTGKPVQEEGWPIEVNKPSELVRKLLPLMRVGVRGMSIYNGAVDVLKMFGIGFVVDAAKIPKGLLDDVQTMVEELKQKTSVEDFDVVHDVLQEGNDKKMTVRGQPLREFKDFMEKNDPGLKKKKNGHFAGLRRIGDPDQGTALWTKLTDPEDIEKALKERTRQRKEEEARQRKEKQDKSQLTTASSSHTNTSSAAAANSVASVGSVSNTAAKTSGACTCCMIM